MTNVFGVLSLIVWALVLVVTVKYVGFILRADNDGEGGVFALLVLIGSQNVMRDHFTRSVHAQLTVARFQRSFVPCATNLQRLLQRCFLMSIYEGESLGKRRFVEPGVRIPPIRH